MSSDMKEIISIHFILDDALHFKQHCRHAPNTGDEIRIGGDGSEMFFTVGKRVWVYDESESPYTRLNVEIAEAR